MPEPHDPRVYFAAERTLLAWLRTGLAVMGIGFLVAKFGLFLRLIAGENYAMPLGSSTVIGVGFVLLGTVTTLVAGWQHWRFSRELPAEDLPRNYSGKPSLFLTMLLGVMGIVLAIYLAWGVLQNGAISHAAPNGIARSL